MSLHRRLSSDGGDGGGDPSSPTDSTASDRTHPLRKQIKRKTKSKLSRVNTSFALEFEEKNVPLEKEVQDAIELTSTSWEDEQLRQLEGSAEPLQSFVVPPELPATLEALESSGKSTPRSAELRHGWRAQAALGCHAHRWSRLAGGRKFSGSAQGSHSEPVGDPPSLQTKAVDCSPSTTTAGEGSFPSIMNPGRSSYSRRSKVHSAVELEEILAAEQPVLLAPSSFPPVVTRRREAQVAPSRTNQAGSGSSHYEFFDRRCPQDSPRNRAAMAQRVAVGRSILASISSGRHGPAS